jgi:trans-aconitate 2-methyltransferase
MKTVGHETIAHRWNPADYARHSQGQERWAKELFSLLDRKHGESVLDVGCGDGRNTAEIAKMVSGGRVMGVDRSLDMVQFAQEHFPPARFPNLSFLQADASELPFDGEFDAVFSNAVLHWVLDHRPVLAGIARSLRPGGRCVLQMGGKGNGNEVVAALEDCLADAKWQAEWRPRESHYGFHGPEEYRQWLQAAGLEADSVELIEKDMVHESREEFPEAVTRRYLSEYPLDPRGQVHVRMIRLQVLAHKPQMP